MYTTHLILIRLIFGFGFRFAAGSAHHPPTHPHTPSSSFILITIFPSARLDGVRYDTIRRIYIYIHTYIQADTVRTTDIHARSSGRSRAPPRIYRGARSIHIRYDCFLLVFIIYSVLVIWFRCTLGCMHVCFFRIGFAVY
ncbi:hypothetical protein B0H11DRAFT_1964695, partial [Mycena galericulata]